jgi:hypothetical protein
MTETCHAPRGIQDILFPVLAVLRTLRRPVAGPPPPRSGRTCSPSIDKRTYAGILIFTTHNMLKPQTQGGIQIPNWVLVLGAIIIVWLIYRST